MAGVGVVRVRRADNSGSYAYGSIEHDQVQRAFDAYNMAGQLSINQAPEQTKQEADLSFQGAFTGVDMALVQPDPHQVNDSTQRAYEQDCVSVRSRPGYARSVFPSEATADLLTSLRDNAVGSVYYKEGANEVSQSGDFGTVTEALAGLRGGINNCSDFMEWNAKAQLTTWYPVLGSATAPRYQQGCRTTITRASSGVASSMTYRSRVLSCTRRRRCATRQRAASSTAAPRA